MVMHPRSYLFIRFDFENTVSLLTSLLKLRRENCQEGRYVPQIPLFTWTSI